MVIAGRYSFNNGEDIIKQTYPNLLEEVETVIASVDAASCKDKKSEEKDKLGSILYAPRRLNAAFKLEFKAFGWDSYNIKCIYPTQYYTENYTPKPMKKPASRQMDFLKEKLGIEVQFGKYAFMVYNVCAKMTIFKNRGIINTGIEIVPIKQFADQMSTGVSFFEQFVWDLQERGVSDIDVPVLILGVDS